MAGVHTGASDSNKEQHAAGGSGGISQSGGGSGNNGLVQFDYDQPSSRPSSGGGNKGGASRPSATPSAPSGPSAEEIEAANNLRKQRAKDAMIAAEKRKAQARRDKEQTKKDQGASSAVVVEAPAPEPEPSKEEKKEEQPKEQAPRFETDPMMATGYLDVEDGEIVDTSGISPTGLAVYEAPTVTQRRQLPRSGQGSRPNDVAQEIRRAFFAPGAQIENGKVINTPPAQSIPEGANPQRPKQFVPPKADDDIPTEDEGYWDNGDAVEGEEQTVPKYSVGPNQNMMSQQDPYDNDAIYTGFKVKKDKEGNVRNDALNQIRERIKRFASSERYDKEFVNMPTDEVDIPSGRMKTPYELRMDDIDRITYRNASFYATGLLPIESAHVNEDGTITYSDDVERDIALIRGAYGCSRTNAMRMIISRIALGYDTVDRVFREDPDDWVIPDWAIERAVVDISESQMRFGHPFALLEKMWILRKSYRFPMPPNRSLARALTLNPNSVLYKNGISPSKLIDMAGKDWIENTYPALLNNTRGAKLEQRIAIEHLFRAIQGMDGVDYERFGVAAAEDRSFKEAMDEAEAEIQANPDNADVIENKKDGYERHRRRLRKTAWRSKKVKDANGNVTNEIERARHGKVDNFFTAWSNFMRASGVIGNLPVMASGVAEHLIGNLNTMEANAFLLAGVSEEFKPSQLMYEEMMTQDALDVIAAAKSLYNAAGYEAVNVFFTEDRPASKAEVRKFLEEYKYINPSKSGQINHWLKNATDILMPGDWAFQKADAKRFIEALMIGMDGNAAAGKAALTSAQIEASMRSVGVGKTMGQIMSEQVGRGALVAMRNQTLGRLSPLTYLINKGMRMSGVRDFLITTCLDTYVTYGVNLVQNMIPFSNTMSYLAVRGVNAVYQHANTMDAWREGRDKSNKPDLDILETQLFGTEEFGQGLIKNFVYDAVRFGNIAAIGILSYIVIQALGGLGDPDDDEDKDRWSTYKIGGENGIEIHLTWWMNDLVMWGMPLGVAMAVHEKHPEHSVNVFWDGVYDMVSGASLLDAANFVVNAKHNIDMIAEMLTNPEYDPGINWASETSKMAEQFLATLMRKSTPGVINSAYRDTLFVGPDALDHDASKTFDRSSDTAKELGKTNFVDDEFDRWRRRESQGNIFYALWNNFWHNGYLFDDGTTEKTGYAFWEQPFVEYKDPARAEYCDQLEYDPNDPNIPQDPVERKAWLEQNANNLIDACKQWDSVEQALANGFMLPYNARLNATEYLYEQINLLQLDYWERCEAGEFGSYENQRAALERVNTQVSEYYDLLNTWFKNEDVPWSDVGYKKLISDNRVYYTWKESGKPATGWDYLLNGTAVEKRYEPIGNHPTSYLPFTVVDDKDRGYNFETIPNWYREGLTDTEGVFEWSQGKTVDSGRDKGQDLSDVLFGGQGEGSENRYHIGPDGVPTIGHRAYIPNEGSIPSELKNMNAKSVAELQGIDLEELEENIKQSKRGLVNRGSGSRKNYNAWRSYGGGGGTNYRSSYNPKIYSNARSVNADKAASMYVKQPYSARTTYLRPSFATKGSREAYRRQDF